MRQNYVDATGKVIAYLTGDKLFLVDDTLIGSLRYDGDIVDDAGETVLIAFHEGLYRGPKQEAIAWLEKSEFAS